MGLRVSIILTIAFVLVIAGGTVALKDIKMTKKIWPVTATILGIIIMFGSVAAATLDSFRSCGITTLGCVGPADPIEWRFIVPVFVVGLGLIIAGLRLIRRKL